MHAEDEALWCEQDFFDELISSSADGIIAFDRDCRCTLWNPAMERMSGKPAADAIGFPAFLVWPLLKELGEDACFYKALSGDSASTKDRPFVNEARGVAGCFDGYYYPLNNDAGEITGGVAIIHKVKEGPRDAKAAFLESATIEQLLVPDPGQEAR